jgi:membrane dipeptidase
MSARLPMADCHNDLLLGVLHQQERGIADPFGDFWLPQLHEGGVVLQVLPVYVEDQFVGEGALRRTLLVLETAWQIADKHKDEVVICTKRGDIATAIAAKKIALVLALEGGEGLGRDVQLVDVFFRMGIRMISLAWNRRTMFADGVGERDTGGRLTSLGVAAIAEMERLGITLDVSHLSENGFWHLAEVSTRPFIASHSSCYELQPHPRNLHDKQILAIAKSGGFVAQNAFGGFLSDAPTVSSYIDHVAHAAQLVGSDHVALGMDFMRDLAIQVDPILGGALVDIHAMPWVDGLDRPADMANLGPLLVERLGVDAATDVAWRTMATLLDDFLPGAK